MSEELLRRIAELERRSDADRALLRRLMAGESFTQRQRIGTGSTGFEQDDIAELLFAAGPGDDDNLPRLRYANGRFAFYADGLGLIPAPLDVGGPRVWHRGDEPAITMAGTPASSTVWTFTNADGDTIPFRVGTVVLMIRGACYVSGLTAGAADATTTFSFAMSSDGTTATLASAPGVRPICICGEFA